MAKAGKRIAVTDRGKLVAYLVPADEPGIDVRAHGRGRAGPTGHGQPSGPPPPPPAPPGDRPLSRSRSRRCATRNGIDLPRHVRVPEDGVRTTPSPLPSRRRSDAAVTCPARCWPSRLGAARCEPAHAAAADGSAASAMTLGRARPPSCSNPRDGYPTRCCDPSTRSTSPLHCCSAASSTSLSATTRACSPRPQHMAADRARLSPAGIGRAVAGRAYPDADFPADPYPGAVPPFSFAHLDGHSHPLTFDVSWRVGGAELDLWLAGHGAPPLAARVPRAVLRLEPQPEQDHLAAPGAGAGRAGRRAARPHRGAGRGVGERVPRPRRAADLRARRRARGVRAARRLDGHARPGRGARPLRGPRRPLPAGPAGHRRRVHSDTDDGLRIEAPWCYLGLSAIRRPLLVDGRPVRCADLGQAAALALDGVPAPDDGLSATTVRGAPDPDEWPAAVFVYGTLQPGHPAWPLLAGHAVGARGAPPSPDACATPASATRRCSPTGRRGAPGWVVTFATRPSCSRRLDRYEGPEYRRIRVAATPDDGPRTACWTYAWAADEAAADRRCRHGWTA